MARSGSMGRGGLHCGVCPAFALQARHSGRGSWCLCEQPGHVAASAGCGAHGGPDSGQGADYGDDHGPEGRHGHWRHQRVLRPVALQAPQWPGFVSRACCGCGHHSPSEARGPSGRRRSASGFACRTSGSARSGPPQRRPGGRCGPLADLHGRGPAGDRKAGGPQGLLRAPPPQAARVRQLREPSRRQGRGDDGAELSLEPIPQHGSSGGHRGPRGQGPEEDQLERGRRRGPPIALVAPVLNGSIGCSRAGAAAGGGNDVVCRAPAVSFQ
mmetsp:Transcript_109518/g.309559  ORF Transcript_109518/g.309559 Transcript_109518/m.309559 type:complete len:270 (+) Transcript_109518:664-1473(+)